VAATAGTLLNRSLQLSSEVYLAMQSRGFRSTPRTMDTFKMQRRDWSFATLTLMITATAIWLGR
jgi:cobalt/nickel transport system permease protein